MRRRSADGKRLMAMTMDNRNINPHPNTAPAPRRTRWRRFRESLDIWHISAAAGILATATAWAVWYFSKIPCTMELARAGVCNPNALANLITLPALTSILAIGAGVATLVGGYSYAMVSKANRRADEAELRLQQERERNDAERQQERERNDAERQRQQERTEQLHDEFRAELAAQRQQADAERQQNAAATQQLIQQMLEDRSQSAAVQQQTAAAQQQLIASMAEISANLTRLVEQQQNGRRNGEG